MPRNQQTQGGRKQPSRAVSARSPQRQVSARSGVSRATSRNTGSSPARRTSKTRLVQIGNSFIDNEQVAAVLEDSGLISVHLKGGTVAMVDQAGMFTAQQVEEALRTKKPLPLPADPASLTQGEPDAGSDPAQG